MSTAAARPDVHVDAVVADESAALKSLDPLELTIELGQTKLSLSEVQQLRPGVILALKEYLNDPVTIFSGSKLVGRGELLLIEGQVGVRITELYRSQASV